MVTSTFPQKPAMSAPTYPPSSDAAAALQADATREAVVVPSLPTLVTVTVVLTGVPPGTWSAAAPRSSMLEQVPPLAAVTLPPLPEPVEKHVVEPTPSSSWTVPELNWLVVLATVAENPPMVVAAVIPRSATATRATTRPLMSSRSQFHRTAPPAFVGPSGVVSVDLGL